MPETVANAVAKREEGGTPAGLITKYSADFAAVLPSHIKSDTWVRIAQGALRKGKRIEAPNAKDPMHPHHGRFELEVAAQNNPGAFLAALLDAARLGLEPGTEQYYLTPRKIGGKTAAHLEILGIVGYQGYVELMYRSGAVRSVLVEVVRENDEYRFQRGIDRVPVHRFRPFAREAERGKLIGVYAYAELLNGAVSKVVELNADDIDRIRRVNPAGGGEYSPWTNWESSMWLKSGARQLRKWVPTSAEFRMEMARAAAEVHKAREADDMPAGVATPQGDAADQDYLDGEVVDDQDQPPAPDGDVEWPEAAQPGSGAPDAGEPK